MNDITYDVIRAWRAGYAAAKAETNEAAAKRIEAKLDETIAALKDIARNTQRVHTIPVPAREYGVAGPPLKEE